MEASFDNHNAIGIHEPMKPRGGTRDNSGQQRGRSGGKRTNSGQQRGRSGGKRANSGQQRGRSGGKRADSGPTEDLTAEVYFFDSNVFIHVFHSSFYVRNATISQKRRCYARAFFRNA